MLVDPLNIFQDIKKAVISFYDNVEVYAIGSRAKGRSFRNGWDFDVAVVFKDEEFTKPKELSEKIKPLFEGKNDEFDKPVKIDFWTVPSSNLEEFKKGIKLRSDAILL